MSINDSIRGNAYTDSFNENIKYPMLAEFSNPKPPPWQQTYSHMEKEMYNGKSDSQPGDFRNPNTHQKGGAGLQAKSPLYTHDTHEPAIPPNESAITPSNR